MRIAVISDVHGNLAALEAVLEAIEAEDVDELWCLGDLVGYGPEPERCVESVLERAAVCLAGNHDLVVTGAIELDVFAHDAAEAAAWTQGVLSEEALARVRRLEPAAERAGVELYHGSIRDHVWEYVLDDETAAACMELQHWPCALVGHSHVALVYAEVDGELLGGAAGPGLAVSLDHGTFILNPGSVGQPRDGDWRAAFLILDLEERTAAWRRVEYDLRRTQDGIRAAGLPLRLAARLAEGR